MKKSKSIARKQKRAYERFLKKTNPLGYKEYKSTSIKRGKEIHAHNVELARDYENSFYEKQQEAIIVKLRNEGKTQVEIDDYIADWVLTLKVWGSGGRPMRLREIRQEKLTVA